MWNSSFISQSKKRFYEIPLTSSMVKKQYRIKQTAQAPVMTEIILPFLLPILQE
jgi:hypothetical protein